MIWLVMIATKGGYKAHSSHTDEQAARQWAKCKEYDGEDTAICEIDKDVLDGLIAVSDSQK